MGKIRAQEQARWAQCRSPVGASPVVRALPAACAANKIIAAAFTLHLLLPQPDVAPRVLPCKTLPHAQQPAAAAASPGRVQPWCRQRKPEDSKPCSNTASRTTHLLLLPLAALMSSSARHSAMVLMLRKADSRAPVVISQMACERSKTRAAQHSMWVVLQCQHAP